MIDNKWAILIKMMEFSSYFGKTLSTIFSWLTYAASTIMPVSLMFKHSSIRKMLKFLSFNQTEELSQSNFRKAESETRKNTSKINLQDQL
jgi:RNAse (barnase) inhibitor barstar